jgi:prepilin-type N-terminal cleavage/methylation domain-containing protein
MRRASAHRQRRGGFTLIEMIVVIGIIVLLAGLLLQVIVKVRETGPRVETKHDIAQIETAMKTFMSTYDVKYFPSAFILTSDYNVGPQQSNNPIFDSRQYYSKVWPKAFLPNPAQNPALVGKTPLPPNLPSAAPNQTLNVIMDGNQTMVFLLGGIGPDFPDQDPALAPFRPVFHGTRNGFLISATNPFGYAAPPSQPVPAPGWYSPPSGDLARGPFFEFKANRIVNGQYLDPYGTPYIVLGSKNGNDYHAFSIYSQVIPNYHNQTGGWGRPQDRVHPFRGLDGKYVNPNGVQIISAGRDQIFGPGGWDEVNNVALPYEPGANRYSPGAPGGDDIANFGGSMLGSD